MQPIRVKVCQESDLRMLGLLARNIQRVLPVTQADIDAAAALGKGWVVWKVIEVSDPLDNLRGGTQLIIKQNSITPGQNVRRVIFVSGPGGETVVIGPAPSPLLLPDAIANSLHYVKAFGGTEQNGTPTPDAPVDIVCNNGALKVRHQSGLPLGYQPYEYITASGNQWLDTGVKLANTDIVETEFKNSSSTGFGALYGVFALGDSSAFYANGTYYGYDVTNNKVNTEVPVDTDWHTLRQDFGNGVITLDGNDTTYTPFEFENTRDNYLFARYYSNGYGYGFKGSCKRFKVIRNGVVICDLIPVVQLSDNAIGMYDLANNVFRGNLGTGDFDITNPINDLEVYVDGTVETINAHGKNLFNINNIQIFGRAYTVEKSGNNIVATAQASAVTASRVDFFIPVSVFKPNTTYYFSTKSDVVLTGNQCNIGKATPQSSTGNAYYASLRTKENGGWSGAFTITDIDPSQEYVSFFYYLGAQTEGTVITISDIMITEGSTATAYEPYYDGGTATAEMLLKVGDYQDVQSILDGVVTRNVGVVVLDGTEGWNSYQSSACWAASSLLKDKVSGNYRSFSTHYGWTSSEVNRMQNNQFLLHGTQRLCIKDNRFETATSFRQFLAEQYAAGTPVIVVYPLAEPTTEVVAGQNLQVTQGDNTLEITQASLTGLELEAEYEQGVQASVEEIEP